MHNRGGSGQPGLFLFYTQGTRKKSRQFTDLSANPRHQYFIAEVIAAVNEQWLFLIPVNYAASQAAAK